MKTRLEFRDSLLSYNHALCKIVGEFLTVSLIIREQNWMKPCTEYLHVIPLNS